MERIPKAAKCIDPIAARRAGDHVAAGVTPGLATAFAGITKIEGGGFFVGENAFTGGEVDAAGDADARTGGLGSLATGAHRAGRLLKFDAVEEIEFTGLGGRIDGA